MTVLVNPLPALGVIQLIDTTTGSCVLLPRENTTAFLHDFMEAVADTIPDNHSRHVPELKVVGGGQSDRGYSLSDPKLVALDNPRGLR